MFLLFLQNEKHPPKSKAYLNPAGAGIFYAITLLWCRAVARIGTMTLEIAQVYFTLVLLKTKDISTNRIYKQSRPFLGN